MQYISTRGLESSFSFSDILFEGYAEDGGCTVDIPADYLQMIPWNPIHHL